MSIRLSDKDYNKLMMKIDPSFKPKSTKNKYRNRRIEVDGIKFDSQNEYERYLELKLLERAGIISNLRYHHPDDKIILLENPSIKYEPDFCYYENNIFIIEDVKGYQTKDFKLKKKMILSKINSGELNAVFRMTKKEKGRFVVIPN